jgi:UDP-2-acetamido-3-amino-2,3-dideoxy-glucuronate N-acetyltransferase
MSKTGTITQSKKSKGIGIIGAAFGRYINALSRYFPMYPSSRVLLQRIRNVNIGRNVFIGADVLLDEVFPENIIIEDDVTIIARSTILSHSFYPIHFKKTLEDKQAKTILRQGCYVGLGSIILPGITIGSYAIVGAGSIITKDIPDYSIVFGNPGVLQGYLCKCKMRLSKEDKYYACKICKRRYTLKLSKLIEIKKNNHV